MADAAAGVHRRAWERGSALAVRAHGGLATDSCIAANGPWFDHQIGGKPPRRSPFPCILGRDTLPMMRLAVFSIQDTTEENEIGEHHAII
jgi:hypothetical protein